MSAEAVDSAGKVVARRKTSGTTWYDYPGDLYGEAVAVLTGETRPSRLPATQWVEAVVLTSELLVYEGSRPIRRVHLPAGPRWLRQCRGSVTTGF